MTDSISSLATHIEGEHQAAPQWNLNSCILPFKLACPCPCATKHSNENCEHHDLAEAPAALLRAATSQRVRCRGALYPGTVALLPVLAAVAEQLNRQHTS